MEHLAGLKIYIAAAEKERLAFHNAPAHNPQTFEKLLPYAIALGVDEPWRAAFADVLTEQPEWASGTAGGMAGVMAGVGRMTHLTGELLQIRGDIKLQVIPYTGGAAQALSDIVAGRISMIVEGYAGMAGIYQAGTLKPLAVGSAQRLEEAPQIPTVAETLPGFVAAGWQVVVAPNGTPEAVVRKVSADLRQVLTKPDMVSRLSLRGSYPRVMTAAETEAFVREQQQLWKPAMERIAGQTN